MPPACEMCKRSKKTPKGIKLDLSVALTDNACDWCRRVVEGEHYCPICTISFRALDDKGGKKVKEEASAADSILCDPKDGGCGRWVHMSCEGITPGQDEAWEEIKYLCPTCRDCKPKEGLTHPKRQHASTCFNCKKTKKGESMQFASAALSKLRYCEAPEGQKVCEDCTGRFNQRDYCQVCVTTLADDSVNSVQCGKCDLWVHYKCEDLEDDAWLAFNEDAGGGHLYYRCPGCRREAPGEGEIIERARTWLKEEAERQKEWEKETARLAAEEKAAAEKAAAEKAAAAMSPEEKEKQEEV